MTMLKGLSCMAITVALGMLVFRLPWHGALALAAIVWLWADYIRARNA